MGLIEQQRPNRKKHLYLALKIGFGLAVFFFVGWKGIKAFNSMDFADLHFHQQAVFLFSLCFFLMVLNWSVEALKWKRLMLSLEKIGFLMAFKGVLAGLSTGILTPNRLGNFIGRTLMLTPEKRMKAALLTILANLAQFIVTVFFGCFGLSFIGLSFFESSTVLLLILGAVFLIFALAFYLKPSRVNRRPFNFFFGSNIEEGIEFISNASNSLKLAVLGLSTLRYFIFVIQYGLLLIAFNQLHFWPVLLAHISVVYLLMTLIPSLFFGKLFVREAAALLVLSHLAIPDAVIILSGFLLWFINIALPSLAGAVFLMGKK